MPWAGGHGLDSEIDAQDSPNLKCDIEKTANAHARRCDRARTGGPPRYGPSRLNRSGVESRIEARRGNCGAVQQPADHALPGGASAATLTHLAVTELKRRSCGLILQNKPSQ